MAERRTEDGAARPAKGPNAPTIAFDAFVSYDRTTDAALAGKLKGRLEKRDERPDRHSELRIRLGDAGSENGALSAPTKRAIERSSHLILLASPASARSPIVRRELDYWRATHGEDPTRVLIARTGGDIVWDHLYDNLDPYATTALACAPAMGVSTTHDPLYAFFEESPRFVSVSKPGISPASRAEFAARCRELVAPLPLRPATTDDPPVVEAGEPRPTDRPSVNTKALPAAPPAAEQPVAPAVRRAVAPPTDAQAPPVAKPARAPRATSAKPTPAATSPQKVASEQKVASPPKVTAPPKTAVADAEWPSLGLFAARRLVVPSVAALVGLTALGLIVFLSVRSGSKSDGPDGPVAMSSTTTTESTDRSTSAPETSTVQTSTTPTTSLATTSRPTTTATSAPLVRSTTTAESAGLRPAPANPRPRPSGTTASTAVPGTSVATTTRATTNSTSTPTIPARRETGTRPVATTPIPRTAAPTTQRPSSVVPVPTTVATTITAVRTSSIPTTAAPTTVRPATTVPRPTTTVRRTTTTRRPTTTVPRTTTTRRPTTTMRRTTTTVRATTTMAPTTTIAVTAPPSPPVVTAPPTTAPPATAPTTTIAGPTPGSSTTTARAVLIPLGDGGGSVPRVGSGSLIPIPDTFPPTSSPLQPAPTSNGAVVAPPTSSACITLVLGTSNPPVCLE